MFLNFFTNLPSAINPIAFSIGGFDIRWYSLGYLMAFTTFAGLIIYRIKKGENPYQSRPWRETTGQGVAEDDLENTFLDILIFAILGLLLGARIGYGLFYNLDLVFHPWLLLYPFSDGEFVGIYGMSFFGGLIGVLLSIYAYCRIKKIDFWSWANFIVPAVGLAYFFGRLGNFLNGELFGRETNLSWGMIFPSDSMGLVRHPSQLYEALLEGLVIFIILWPLRNNEKIKNRLFVLFLVLYGSFRFLIEFVRDEEFFGVFTTGQWLSLGIVVAGISLIISPFLKGD